MAHAVMTDKQTAQSGDPQTNLPKGAKLHYIKKADGSLHPIAVVSFRDPRHLDLVVDYTMSDKPFAFHGWGVMGAGKRVDKKSNFWGHHLMLKKGRSLGSKIPLLEPPEYAVKHIDWNAVHPSLQYLKDPKEFAKLWSSGRPFHIIAPYNAKGDTLTPAVVTSAYDKEVASHTSVYTVCIFWINDPALVEFMKRVKKIDYQIQIGVTSLNDPGQLPDFFTDKLIETFKKNGVTLYDLVVEDPLLEPLQIASSHSQFALPLKDQLEPVFTVKRKGSLSPAEFSRLTGFKVVGKDDAPIAAHLEQDGDYDEKMTHLAEELKRWEKEGYLRTLKQLISLG